MFDPVAAEILETARQTAQSCDTDDTRTQAMRHADAIIEIFGFFNANNTTAATPRHHPNIDLHYQTSTSPTGDNNEDGDPLLDGCAITANGRPLPSWATDALTCDCVMHRVVRAGASVLDYGRTTRDVPKPLWRAVAARDQHCRFPGCDRNKAWCNAHHITWWRRHGETNLQNLLLLCQRHHLLVHKHDWHINLDPATAVATFILTNGQIRTSTPTSPPTIRGA